MFGNFPNISGWASMWGARPYEYVAPFYLVSGYVSEQSNVGSNNGRLGFDASRVSSLYSDDVTTVQAPSNQNLIIIKF